MAEPAAEVEPEREPAAVAEPASVPALEPSAGPPRPVQQVLEQLAALHPALFGAEFQPLKRGVFEDLLAAHPGAFARAELKEALGRHARSTRYLTVVAAGGSRRDLAGQAVEPLAPEHVHHALLEVFRRRQHKRPSDDLRSKLRARIVQAFEASGLTREAYAERVRSRDDRANAVLDEALAEAAARGAKDEALLRAFEAANRPLEAFADMYGLDPRVAARTLERARRVRTAALAPSKAGEP